jgi:hypothetical protein
VVAEKQHSLLKFLMQQNSARFELRRQSDEKQCALKKMSEMIGARPVGLGRVRSGSIGLGRVGLDWVGFKCKVYSRFQKIWDDI